MTAPDTIKADSELNCFAPNGTRVDNAGWYVYHGDDILAGASGNGRSGESQSWLADIGRKLTRAEAATHRAKVEGMQRERETEETKREAAAREQASLTWAAAKATAIHPYLA